MLNIGQIDSNAFEHDIWNYISSETGNYWNLREKFKRFFKLFLKISEKIYPRFSLLRISKKWNFENFQWNVERQHFAMFSSQTLCSLSARSEIRFTIHWLFMRY